MRLPRHAACKVNGTPVCTLCEKHTQGIVCKSVEAFLCAGFSFFCRLMWLLHVTVCTLFTGSAVELWDTVAQKKMVKRDATAHICLHHREEEGGGVPAYCKTSRIREVHNLFLFFLTVKKNWVDLSRDKIKHLGFKFRRLWNRLDFSPPRSLNKYQNLIKQVVMLTAFDSIQCHRRLQAASEGGESGQLNYANVCQFNESEAEN